MPKVRVLPDYCKGCGLCVVACPRKILYLSERVDRRGVHVAAIREKTECTGCASCAIMCPDAALEVDE